MKARRADIGLAACVIVFAGIYLYADSQLPSAHIGDPLGPKAFPALLAGGLLISGLMLVYETWKKQRSQDSTIEDAAPQPVNKRQLVILAAMVAWTALYYFSFERLGYLIATPIFLFGLLSHFHRGHLRTNILVAIGFTGVVYTLFSLLLGVPLPTGVLPI